MTDDVNRLIETCSSLSLSDSGAVYNKPGLPLIVVNNEYCHAVVCPQGAHLIEFNRKGQEGNSSVPFLWLSPEAVFSPKIAIRGGIPICFPWFGPHPHDPTLPQHGFASVLNWQLTRAIETADVSELTFSVTSSDETLRTYNHAFSAEIIFRLGKTLAIQLSVKNLGQSTMPIGWALHSYFPVSDTSRTTVPELVGSPHIDKTDHNREKALTRNLDFSQHTDAVFTQSPEKITLVRPEGNLYVASKNAPTTITWNPNTGAQDFKYLSPTSYRDFVCVERGAAFADTWKLPSGESFSAGMEIATEK